MIGYSVNIGAHAWYRRLAPAAAAVAAADGVELVVTDAAGDAALQLTQLHGLLDRGAWVLAISPMDPAGLGDVLARCAAGGVPVLTESIATGDARVAAHLGIDEYGVGVRLGLRVGRELAPRELVRVLLVGFPPYAEAADREAGFLSGLRRTHEQVDVLCAQGGGTTAAAEANVAALLAGRPDWRPDVVFGVDDEVLLGGLAAAGSSPQLTATYGISPPRGPELIEDGTVSWGAAMLPELHGQVLGTLALHALAGHPVPALVRIAAAIVTHAGHAEGWDRYYARAGDDWRLIPYHADQLLPPGVRVRTAGPV